ncbi:MAG: helix-turn-helix domain-containing protein [Bacillota bacterium]|nr:helix-turn-helix domain-containing protein [Bacillota bacterium]
MMRSKKTIAVPPGATIREQLEMRGMRQKEFATRLGLSEKHVSRLINGQVELTKDVSIRLESVLGVPASYWNNLESIFREKLARVEDENQLDVDAEIAKLFPYPKIAKLGWVPKTSNAEEKALNLRRFFEVSKLDILEDLKTPGIACRKLGASGNVDYSLAVWAQKARIEAREYDLSPINLSGLKSVLPRIREMTIMDPEDFCGELIKMLAKYGIAIVFLPHIGGSFLHGATFYEGKNIVMGLTARGKDADRFWFSLFHEINHILSGHINNPSGTSDSDEEESDIFAKNILIPSDQYNDYIERECFSKKCIIEFANVLGVAPCIVLGRLQKENYVPYNRYHDLKIQYSIL